MADSKLACLRRSRWAILGAAGRRVRRGFVRSVVIVACEELALGDEWKPEEMVNEKARNTPLLIATPRMRNSHLRRSTAMVSSMLARSMLARSVTMMMVSTQALGGRLRGSLVAMAVAPTTKMGIAAGRAFLE